MKKIYKMLFSNPLSFEKKPTFKTNLKKSLAPAPSKNKPGKKKKVF